MMVSVKKEELARIKRANARMRNENQVLRCTLKNLERNPYLECKEVLKAISNFCSEHYKSERTRRGPLGPPYTCPDDCPPCQDDKSNNFSPAMPLLGRDARSNRNKVTKAGERSRLAGNQHRLCGDGGNTPRRAAGLQNASGNKLSMAGESSGTDATFLDDPFNDFTPRTNSSNIEVLEFDSGSDGRDIYPARSPMIELATYDIPAVTKLYD